MGNTDTLNKRINELITLRVMGTSSNSIWEQFGVKEDNKLYYEGDKNLYECKDSKISNETCSRVAITSKILNDLNISYDDSNSNFYSNVFYNNNSGVQTGFSCEIYKLTGVIIKTNIGDRVNPNYVSSDYFNEDACLLENTFPDETNILRLEKRLFYSKKERKANSNLELRQNLDGTEWVIGNSQELLEANNGNLEEQTPDLPQFIYEAPYLTDEWSDDFIVNTYIMMNALDSSNDFNLHLGGDGSSQRNLWQLVSIIMNENFKFYENKIKAKSKVKELMQLKTIGLLDDNTWTELGFYEICI